MEIRVLKYFLAIVREETISGAAEYLHITQPTLSRQIKELEDYLGKPLFIRGNRKISLTEEGMLLRKRAEEILSLVEKTETEVSSDNDLQGDIYIGSGETYVMEDIAKVIKKMQLTHPQVKFHFFSGDARDVNEKLEKGLLDFGLLINPGDLTKYDYLHLQKKDTWGLLMLKDAALARKKYVVADDLPGIPLLVSKQSLDKNELGNWLKNNQSKLNIVTTYNLIYNASLLVKANCGYALCLKNLIATEGNSTFCFRELHPKLEANVVIVWKKYQLFSKAAEYFLSLLKTEFEN